MAKQTKVTRLTSPSSGKARGRTAKTMSPDELIDSRMQQERRTDTHRPVSSGGGKLRGDRRDMSPTYTGNARHAARGNNPRKDVSTRKR